MMSLVVSVLVWSATMLTNKVGFWMVILVVSLFFLKSLLISPVYFGFSMVGYDLLFDTLTYSLWVLSVWLVILMVTASFKVKKEKVEEVFFVFLLNLMLLFLVLTFSMSNYLGLYIFFEASLIPTLLVIIGWGYQTERLQAGVYFLFYTMSSSLPLLGLILFNYSTLGSLGLNYEMLVVTNSGGWGWLELFSFLAMTVAFLVKMPLFFVHLWLPSAHVEAPVAGSMILAGVLLKLGGYGLCRVMWGFPMVGLKMSSVLVSLGLVSMVCVGLVCCRLNDMKALVAYSSVAHMGLAVTGLYLGGVIGFVGALIMMIGHGVASSGLFMVLNVYYERTGSRSFYLNSGMLLVAPVVTLVMFLLCASNMGAPPTINLLSELYLLGGLMGFDWVMVCLLPLGSFLGVVFTIFLFSHSQHGKLNYSTLGCWKISIVELNSLFLHIIPVNFLVLKFDLFLLWM